MEPSIAITGCGQTPPWVAGQHLVMALLVADDGRLLLFQRVTKIKCGRQPRPNDYPESYEIPWATSQPNETSPEQTLRRLLSEQAQMEGFTGSFIAHGACMQGGVRIYRVDVTADVQSWIILGTAHKASALFPLDQISPRLTAFDHALIIQGLFG